MLSMVIINGEMFKSSIPLKYATKVHGQHYHLYSFFTATLLINNYWTVRLTGVCAEVACQCIAAAAGIAAAGALEGLLPTVQLEMPQQVAFLRKSNSTLAALEGPVTCRYAVAATHHTTLCPPYSDLAPGH